jgi:FkbH-like protein
VRWRGDVTDVDMENELRSEVESSLEKGHWGRAYSLVCRIWRGNPSPSTGNYVASRCEKMAEHLGFAKCKVAVLRSFTVEPAVALLKAEAFVAGIHLEVYLGGFNAVAQEILNEQGALYRFAPDIVIVAVLTRDITPRLWEEFTEMTRASVEDECSRVKEAYRSWIQAFRRCSKASLVLHNLEEPANASAGILDHQSELGQLAVIRDINKSMQQEAMRNRGVFVMDFDGLVARCGRIAWRDEKKWLTMRMPIAAEHLSRLAKEWTRHIRPLAGKTCKVLVADLDNTLWGGVIGEDGLEGIEIGPDYPGAYYRDVQRCLLDLKNRGVVLAVCSKNDPDEALAVFDKHPGMLLRRKDISCWRINWNDKAQNLREIVADLNVGVESLAFLDDNPVERERVREELPEVTVLELPNNPSAFAEVLRESQVFERHYISREDGQRAEYYAHEGKRAEARKGANTLEEFYVSLKQEVEVALVTADTTARVAQLTQKTNQFNLTTRRYTEQQISDLASRDDARILYAKVRDRFGDNGIVGVGIIKLSGEKCELDTFLLSCRVIGRTVETAFIAAVAGEARKCGARRLKGLYLPTQKNGPARGFLEQHGFEPVADSGSSSAWELDLDKKTVACPEWIRMKAIDDSQSKT